MLIYQDVHVSDAKNIASSFDSRILLQLLRAAHMDLTNFRIPWIYAYWAAEGDMSMRSCSPPRNVRRRASVYGPVIQHSSPK